MGTTWSKESNTTAASTGSTSSTSIQIDSGESFLVKNSSASNIFTLAESTGDTTVTGDLTINGNDIKSNGGTTAISISGNDVTTADNLTVTGDLTVTGGKITFGNLESIHNETDSTVHISSPNMRLSTLANNSNAKFEIKADTNYDGILWFSEGALAAKWAIGNDATDDKLKFEAGVATLGSATKMSFDSCGNVDIAGSLETDA